MTTRLMVAAVLSGCVVGAVVGAGARVLWDWFELADRRAA